MDRDVWGLDRPDYRGIFWLNVLGKLRPGVTKNQAQAELNLLMRGIAERFPEDHRDSPNEISLDPLWRSPFGINGYLYKIFPMLLGLAGGSAPAGLRQRCQSPVGAFGRTPPRDCHPAGEWALHANRSSASF